MLKTRYLFDPVQTLCLKRDKICFITGPRQVGKTTLAKAVISNRKHSRYWNWDETNFRRIWTKDPTQVLIPKHHADSKEKPAIVFDEIHKARLWKRTLKGLYDTLEEPVDIIVTGSARLDTYQKGSDSLQGRYIPFRLHPLSVGELSETKSKDPEDLLKTLVNNPPSSNPDSNDALHNLLVYGGFPEPFFAQSSEVHNIWIRNRVEKIIREDLRDLSKLPELSQIEMLTSLLPERAAQPLSRQSLREDLEVAHTTITRWLTYLSSLYYFFELKPYSHRIKNSLKKEGKIYLWDWSEVETPGSRFENLIASHLLKACHFWTDTGKGNFDLFYLKNKSKQEIDFLITKNKKPWLPIEVKSQSTNLSPNWQSLLPQLNLDFGLQLVNKNNINQEKGLNRLKVRIISTSAFLQLLP